MSADYLKDRFMGRRLHVWWPKGVLMMATRYQVYDAIDGERDYQDRLWPQVGATDGAPNQLTIGEFLLLAEEYCAAARKIWAQEPKPEVGTLNIIRKIAGIAVNCMEQHGAPLRDGPRRRDG